MSCGSTDLRLVSFILIFTVCFRSLLNRNSPRLAVLTVTLVIWLQVEYRVKQRRQWQALRSDVIKFDELAVDYFYRINILALVSSIKRHQWPVAVAITGTLLLQAAVVLSTGLFERQLHSFSIQSEDVVTTFNFSHSDLYQVNTGLVILTAFN
jgi:Protein of unknown function (DUF3433)